MKISYCIVRRAYQKKTSKNEEDTTHNATPGEGHSKVMPSILNWTVRFEQNNQLRVSKFRMEWGFITTINVVTHQG